MWETNLLRAARPLHHRAYGRAYLGSCIEYLQYGDRDRAFECFQKMANVCPELLIEVDTYYQLGCGDQPKGSMGNLASLDVKRNSAPLFAMMNSLFLDAIQVMLLNGLSAPPMPKPIIPWVCLPIAHGNSRMPENSSCRQ